LDAIKSAFGENIIEYWSSFTNNFIFECVQNYCISIEKSLLSINVIPGPMSQLTITGRGILIINKTSKKENLISRPIQKAFEKVPEIINSYFGQKITISDEFLNVENLCLRCGNLDFVKSQLIKIKEKYMKPEDPILEKIIPIIDKTIYKIYEFIGNKIAFIDFKLIFANLYQETAENTLAKGLNKNIELFRTLRRKTETEYFAKFLEFCFKSLVNAWIYYLLEFICQHKLEEILPILNLIKEDEKFCLEYFSNTENSQGLSEKIMNDELNKLNTIIELLKKSDQDLILLYKNADHNSDEIKDVLVRILYGRNTKEVEKFFELHQNIILN